MPFWLCYHDISNNAIPFLKSSQVLLSDGDSVGAYVIVLKKPERLKDI
jgi:hypothetical protein